MFLVQDKTIPDLINMVSISLKMTTRPLVKPYIVRTRSLHYRFIVFQSGLTSLCFVDDLCQILGMFSLNSIGCVTKCGPAGILEEIQPTDVCKASVLKSS